MNDNGAKVYVVQDSRHPLVGAEKFGELVFLVPKLGQVVTYMNQPLVREMRRKLKGYDGRRDYILPVGDPAAIGIAVALASEMGGRYVRILRYDRQKAIYYPVDVDLADRLVKPEDVA